MKNIFSLALAMLFALAIQAQTSYTWTGGTNSNWGNAGNWSPAGIPQSGDNVTFSNASPTNSLVLDTARTVNNITVSASTLNLNGLSITVNGSTSLTGGTINNGTVNFTNTTTTIAGTTFGAVVNITANSIGIGSSTFSSAVTVNKTGSGTDTWNGGNTFQSTFHFYSTTGSTNFTTNSNNTFNGNITIENTGSGTVAFANGTGTSTLGTGVTVSIGSTNGFTNGTLHLRNVSQSSATAQTLTLTGTSTLQISGSSLAGNITASAPLSNFGTSSFGGTLDVTKTSSTTASWAGGNTYTGDFTLSVTNGNIDLTFTANNTYNGNIIINNSGSGTIALAGSGTSYLATSKTVTAGTFNSGTLNLKNLVQYGSTAQSITLGGTATLQISGSTFNGNLTASAPYSNFGTSTFNGTVTLTKSGSSSALWAGGNTFANNFKVTVSNGGLDLGFTTGNTYQGNLEFENTGSGAIRLAASGTATSTLASGKTITIGSGGFAAGSLTLSGLTQSGSTAQSLTLTGSATLNVSNATFNGALTINSPNVQITGSTLADLTVTKTSSSTNTWSGANTYNGNVSITNTGTGYINLSSVASGGDVYYGNATFTKSSTGDILLVGSASTVTFKGNVTLSGITSTQFTGSQVALFNGSNAQTLTNNSAITWGNVTINKASNSLTLATPLNINTALTLTSGKIITTSTNIVNFADNATVSSASNSSYIQGPVSKTGNDAFTFPTGKTASYRPISIGTQASTATVFTAEYFDANQSLGTSADTSVSNLSECEYWTLTRSGSSNNVDVTLSWNGSSCNGAVASNMRVIGWNGSQWTNYGNGAYTGTATAGTVRSNTQPTAYNAFTLANQNCTTTASITPSGATSFCSGGSVTLTASSSYRYKWNTGATTQAINASTTGTYSVLVRDSLGCKLIVNQNVTVWSNPTISAGLDRVIMNGDTIQLNANGSNGTPPYTYNWTPGTGLSAYNIVNPLCFPTLMTDYIVTITDDNGCTNIDTIKVQPFDTTNLNNLTLLAGDSIISESTIKIIGNIASGSEIDALIVLDEGNIYENGVSPTIDALAELQLLKKYLFQKPSQISISGNLNGQVLTPGVYEINSSALLTDTLSLNGDSTSVFVFNIHGNLSIDTFAVINVDSLTASNIIWNVDSAITSSNVIGTFGRFISNGDIRYNSQLVNYATLYSSYGKIALSNISEIRTAGAYSRYFLSRVFKKQTRSYPCIENDVCQSVYNGDFDNLPEPLAYYIEEPTWQNSGQNTPIYHTRMRCYDSPFDWDNGTDSIWSTTHVCFWKASSPNFGNSPFIDYRAIVVQDNYSPFTPYTRLGAVRFPNNQFRISEIVDTISIVTGQPYKLTFRVRKENFPNNADLEELKVFLHFTGNLTTTQLLAHLTNISDTTWKFYSYCFVADTNFDKLTVRPNDIVSNGDTSLIGIDDVYITQPELDITANDTIVCPNDSVVLSAVFSCFGPDLPYADYLWSNGDTTPTIVVTPEDTTMFSVTVSIGNCSYTDSIQIYVLPAPDSIFISGNPFACPDSIGHSFYTAVGNNDSTYTYQWNVLGNGNIIGPDSLMNVSVAWESGGFGDTLVLTVCNNLGCCLSDTLFIKPCCFNTDTSASINLVIYEGNYDKATDLIPYAIANGFGTGTTVKGNFYVNGTFYVDTTLTLAGVHIYFAPGARIVVNSGESLTITISSSPVGMVYSVLEAGCDMMWAGIYAQHSSCTLNINTKTRIRNAMRAVFTTACANITVDDSEFDQNYMDIFIHGCSQSPPSTLVPMTITNNKFMSTAPLLPSLTSGGVSIGPRTQYHIYAHNVRQLKVGDTGQGNEFSNANFGIFINGGRLLSTYNTFKNMRYNLEGIGIYFNGQTTSDRLTLNQHNLFDSCLVGVYAKNRAQVVLQNTNTFNQNFVGLYAHHIPNRTVNVNGATFQNNYISILAEDVPSTGVTLGYCDITNTNNDFKHIGTGIAVQNPAPFSTNAVVQYNDVSDLQHGIISQNISWGTSNIIGNTITYNLSPTDMLNSGNIYTGIYTDHCGPQFIQENNVSNLNTTLTDSLLSPIFKGIRTLSSPIGMVGSNSVLRAGNGLEIEGFNLHTQYICNTLDSCNVSMMFIDSTTVSNQREGFSNKVPAANNFLNPEEANLDGSTNILNGQNPIYLFDQTTTTFDPSNGGVPINVLNLTPSNTGTDPEDCNTFQVIDTSIHHWLRLSFGQDMLYDAINDSISFTSQNDLNNYYADNFAYLALKYVPDVQDSSIDFADFFDDMDKEPMGSLFNVADASFIEVLDTTVDVDVFAYMNSLKQAIADNNAITPTNTVEGYRKLTYGIYLNALLREVPDWAPDSLTRTQVIDSIFGADTTGIGLLDKPYGYRLTMDERDTLATIIRTSSYLNGDGIVTARVLYGFDDLRHLRKSNIQPESPQPDRRTTLILYPNPTTGIVNILVNSEEKGIFEIYDLQGKCIYSQAFAKGIPIVKANVGSHSNGLYFCRVVLESGRIETGKLLLQRE